MEKTDKWDISVLDLMKMKRWGIYAGTIWVDAMLLATKNVHQSILEVKGHAMSPAVLIHRVNVSMIAPYQHLKHALPVSDDALLPVMIHVAVKIVLLSFLDVKQLEFVIT
ncbi:hypothetical protein Ddye_032301 [Dipteronia dyeriana]|uniref:Uncharacterized protein n=1 Tax=Dipteronia dyeriana TaxID=168575 RepID=A0AAD9TJX4_9ROSI|nr:hypothetical protein Ddye_032301 [Dipteronia dyeriana]